MISVITTLRARPIAWNLKPKSGHEFPRGSFEGTIVSENYRYIVDAPVRNDIERNKHLAFKTAPLRSLRVIDVLTAFERGQRLGFIGHPALPIALDRFAIWNKLAVASIAESEGFIHAPRSLIDPNPPLCERRLSGRHFIQYQQLT
jgi:hypothetical protein